MDFTRKLFTWGGLAVALLLLYAFIHPLYRQGEASVAGKTAPDFALTLENRSMHLSDLRGKVVILNFWATWCPPCIEETPALNRLQRLLAPHGGMVLGISADSDPDAYEKFLRDQKVAYATFRDPNLQQNLSQIGLHYGSSMYPETYIKIGRAHV